jgi:hypothetical protein
VGVLSEKDKALLPIFGYSVMENKKIEKKKTFLRKLFHFLNFKH